MAVRIECTADGFEDNWVELDMDRWTIRETIELDEADLEGMVDLLRRKVTACRIELNNGKILAKADDFDKDTLLDADELILGWLGGVFHRAIGRRRILGNLSARPLSNSNEVAAPIAT